MKRLQVLSIQFRQEPRSSVRRRWLSVLQQSRRRLLPSASIPPTRPSKRRGRRSSRERHETRRALLTFASVRGARRESVRPVYLRDPSTASRHVQLQAASSACRCSLSTVQPSALPFSFSGLQWFHRRAILRRFLRRPASCQNRSPRAFANFVHRYTQQLSRRRLSTRSAVDGIAFAESFGPLRFNGGNACFKGGDPVSRFFAEDVRPILYHAQNAGRHDIAGHREHGGKNPTNLFSVKPGRSRNAGRVAGFAQSDIAGGTGNSGKRFSNGRRRCQGDQLPEFVLPSVTPRKKTAAVGSIRSAASGRLPCLPSV